MLPVAVESLLLDHLKQVRQIHERDLAKGWARFTCRTRSLRSTRMPSASGLDYQSFDPSRLVTHHVALVTAFETEAAGGY